ncbi:peptidoglycan-binding domain-containing protein [uncultured Paludibaculum sp.]|uniref:peptidoglycan-binding domain-containing protein n=1 Tax=uncultured Paludibaculum sp. TaxID=1765020 RepID=UPI002AAB8D87|nr:peptidoglycan-binding domain-containing protein [uncultured Paludibaculum sp.]
MAGSWKEIDDYLRAHGVRIGPPTTGQTTGGGHATNSYHYIGTARDYGLYDSDAAAVACCLHPVARMRGTAIAELFFGPLNIWYVNGSRVPGSSIGGHMDHCHVALAPGRHMPKGQARHVTAHKTTQKTARRAPKTFTHPWQEIDEFLQRRNLRIGPPTVPQTTGGQHEHGSYHSRGLARDYGVGDSDAARIAQALLPFARRPRSPIFELFFAPLDIWYQQGHPIDGKRVGGHTDHVHVALEIGRHLVGDALPAQAVAMPGRAAGGSGSGHSALAVLDYGAAGSDVVQLQQHLNSLGAHLVVDGKFGPRTEEAVLNFQRIRGLAQDGIVGPKTWAALLRT